MPTRIARRTFMQWTAAAGTIASLRQAAAAPAMYVSLNASLTRQLAWPEFVRLGAKLGYGGVDVNLVAARAEGVDRTRALVGDLGIVPAVAGLPVRFSGEEAAFSQDLPNLGEAAAFLSAIGCPRVQTVLPPSSATPKAELRPILKQRVTAIAEILVRSQVQLGLEFLAPLHFRTRQPHEFIWRMDEAVAFATECGPNVGVVLDAWHWHHAGATGADILAAGRSRIVTVHVSDAKRQPPEEVRDNQRLMPGEGVIDLVTFFQSLQRIGYAGAISPEPIGRVPAEMSAEDGARWGLDATVAVMRKAGVA
jgi:sugar phosphate isomerase/epimerase